MRDRATYAFRFMCCFLTMEAVLHTMYVVAIKDTQAWEGDSPADLSMIGFWNLVIVWLKVSSGYLFRCHVCLIFSCCCLGVISGSGLYWTEWIHRKI